MAHQRTKLQFKLKFGDKVRYYYSSNIIIGSTFEGANKIGRHTKFIGTMGYGSFIGDESNIEAEIGRFTSIAPHVYTNRGIHPYLRPYVTTCPMFFSTEKQNGETFASEECFDEFRKVTIIGNDCWIGESVFLCGDIKIGDGAVVYAGAVVTKDVPPYAIVAGVPAKIIKYRYDEETIKYLLNIKWWNFPIDWLRKHWKLLNDIEKLKKELSKKTEKIR